MRPSRGTRPAPRPDVRRTPQSPRHFHLVSDVSPRRIRTRSSRRHGRSMSAAERLHHPAGAIILEESTKLECAGSGACDSSAASWAITFILQEGSSSIEEFVKQPSSVYSEYERSG